MIVLNSSTLTQTFEFIPSEYAESALNTYYITIHSETENKQVYSDEVTTFAQEKYFYIYSGEFNLKNKNFYLLKIKKNEELIFSDLIFCTDQVFTDVRWNADLVWNLLNEDWDEQADRFSVNEGNYVEHGSNNEFIII